MPPFPFHTKIVLSRWGGRVLMPPVKVDPAKVKTFRNANAFYRWLSVHHKEEQEVWIRIYKVGSGLKSITPKEAIDVCLCWGWIDAVRKRFDDKSYLQRYTRRRKRSIWSQINVDNVTRLIAEGRMTAHGLDAVEAAKADGRWDRAYGSGRKMTIPDDLQAAIDAAPKARRMLATLSAQTDSRWPFACTTRRRRPVGGRRSRRSSQCSSAVRRFTPRERGRRPADRAEAARHVTTAQVTGGEIRGIPVRGHRG
jgi:uncharacterized protein YdeI (YjbR/CyaY-like superfamily)